jgi:hypothetical protein
MSENNLKALPGGTWVYFKGLAPTVTNESLSAYLCERGLIIAPEAISLRVFNSPGMREPSAGAMVSVSREAVLDMLLWVLNGDAIEGRVPRVELAHCSKKCNS